MYEFLLFVAPIKIAIIQSLELGMANQMENYLVANNEATWNIRWKTRLWGFDTIDFGRTPKH